MVDVFNSGIPCPSTNGDGVEHVIFLKGTNLMFRLFEYLSWDGYIPSMPTKNIDTQALACICKRDMQTKITKNKFENEELSRGDMVNLSMFSGTFYPLIKWEAEK